MSTFYSTDPEGLNVFLSETFANPTFEYERKLNLETDDVDGNESTRRIQAFRDRFKLNNAPVYGDFTSIPKSAIDQLYSYVSNIPNDKKHLTALFTHFANRISGSTHTLILLFEPVKLRLVGYNSESLTYMYQVVESSGNYFFDEGDQKFHQCRLDTTNNIDEAKTLRNNYRGNNVNIKRDFDINVQGSGYIPQIDIESQLFPFQLIYTLLKDNNATDIGFKNCMSEYVHDETYYYKHSLLMYAHPQLGGSGAFNGKFANRSHLCPPCHEFGYILNLDTTP